MALLYCTRPSPFLAAAISPRPAYEIISDEEMAPVVAPQPFLAIEQENGTSKIVVLDSAE